MSRRGSRFGASLVLVLLGAALVQLGIAAALYAGGSWVDRTQPGYGLWHNFVCDLAREFAINGQLNPGAGWGRAGQWTLQLAVAVFWLTIPSLFGSPRHARAVPLSGTVSTLALTLLPLTFDVPHALALLGGGVLALAAGAMSVSGLRCRPTLASLGGVTLLLGAADLGLYLVHRGYPVPTVITVLQRLLFFTAVAWLTACALVLLGESRRPPSESPSSARGRR